jgi:protein-tyrosine-phosphatase
MADSVRLWRDYVPDRTSDRYYDQEYTSCQEAGEPPNEFRNRMEDIKTRVVRSLPAPLQAVLRRGVRFLRNVPDRALHRLRRRRALTVMERYGFPESVLFVCHGNICRSPYAAYAFERLLPAEHRARVRITSAGFVGPDRPSPGHALRVAAARGLDMSAHRSQLLTFEGVTGTNLIVVMEPVQQAVICSGFGRHRQHVLVLGDLDPQPIETRTILDPYSRTEEAFVQSYDRIDRCLRELTDVLTPSLRASRPSAVPAPGLS